MSLRRRYLLISGYSLAAAGLLTAPYAGLAGVLTLLPLAVIALLVAALTGSEGTARRASSSGSRKSPFLVTFDDATVTVTCPGRKTETVAWSDLVMVGIRIEDGFLPEPWWVLGGSKSGCLFPTDAEGGREFLVELQRRLPGFDNRALIEVMGSVDRGRVLWEARQGGTNETDGREGDAA